MASVDFLSCGDHGVGRAGCVAGYVACVESCELAVGVSISFEAVAPRIVRLIAVAYVEAVCCSYAAADLRRRCGKEPVTSSCIVMQPPVAHITRFSRAD